MKAATVSHHEAEVEELRSDRDLAVLKTVGMRLSVEPTNRAA